MKHIIKVNEDSCIGCEMCIKDCPQQNIYLSNNKAIIKSDNCIKCGHCSAICPNESIEISGYDEKPKYVNELNKIKPDELLNSIMSRRSIRQFTNKEIPKEYIENIIEAGRLSPTAKNSQSVSYIIIEKDKRKIEDIAVNVFRRFIKILGIFKKSYKNLKIDDDFFFKKAPLIIGVVSNSKVDGALAASNMALMAESLELGVLYSGFFSFASKISFGLKKELGLKKEKIVTTLVIGYPNVKYRRTALRDKAEIIYR